MNHTKEELNRLALYLEMAASYQMISNSNRQVLDGEVVTATPLTTLTPRIEVKDFDTCEVIRVAEVLQLSPDEQSAWAHRWMHHWLEQQWADRVNGDRFHAAPYEQPTSRSHQWVAFAKQHTADYIGNDSATVTGAWDKILISAQGIGVYVYSSTLINKPWEAQKRVIADAVCMTFQPSAPVDPSDLGTQVSLRDQVVIANTEASAARIRELERVIVNLNRLIETLLEPTND